MPGGQNADGIAGLIDYVNEKHRLHDFERNLCRKVLGYALGRSVMLSDQPLLQEMENQLRAERLLLVLFETVVLSPQFRRQRGRDYMLHVSLGGSRTTFTGSLVIQESTCAVRIFVGITKGLTRQGAVP